MLILLKILPRLFTQTHLSLRLIYLLIILLWIEDVNKRIKMISLPHLHYRSNKSYVYYFRGILSCGYDKDMINSHLDIFLKYWIPHFRQLFYAFKSLARFNSSPLIILLPSHMPPCFLVQVPCICNVNNDLAFQTYRWHFHCQLHSFLCVHECSCYLWYAR